MLPLAVIENQLRRIDEELRRVNMKAAEFGREEEGFAARRLIEARLEHIDELLASIAGLVYDIGADIQPEERPEPPRQGGSLED